MFAQLIQCYGQFLVVSVLIVGVNLQFVLFLGGYDTFHKCHGRIVLAAVLAFF